MDAIKILGSLLGNNAMGSKSGGNILETLFGEGDQNAATSILGALLGGGQRQGENSGLGALGGLLGAASKNQRKGGSGLDLLGALLGGGGSGGSASASGSKGNAGGLGALGALLGGGNGGEGGGSLGDLLGGLLGGEQPGGQKSGSGTSGGNGSELLASILGASPGPQNEPPPEAHNEAEILIEAMCNAVKVDGRVDDQEKEEIIGRLGGDVDENEAAFVREKLSSPLDLDAFLAKIPDDMAHQVYAFSLMAVRLDSNEEAQYFARLASGLGLDAETANEIHAQMSEPEIFR